MRRARSDNFKIWFRDEIENVIHAIDAANGDIASCIDTPEMALYRKGYEAALNAVAEALGVEYAPYSPSVPCLPALPSVPRA